MTRISPTIEAEATQTAFVDRIGKSFEPVALPTYRPWRRTFGQVVRAILPGLGVLLLTGWLLACVGAFVAGYAR